MVSKLKELIYKKIDDKGMFDFDFVIGVILILSLIVIIPDSFTVTAKMNAISRANKYAVSAISRQGFISYYNYDSGNLPADEFTSNATIINNVKTILANAGYNPNSVKISVNGFNLTNYSFLVLQYGDEVKVKITAEYDLRSTNMIYPNMTNTISNTATGVCTRMIRR